MASIILIMIMSAFSADSCGSRTNAWCFEPPKIGINTYFEEAEDMMLKLRCEFNKEDKKADIDCTEENLSKVDQLYQRSMLGELNTPQLIVVYSHYAYFLLWYRNDLQEARKYSDKALTLNNNDDLSMFVNVMCDCFQTSQNPRYENLIKRIELLDNKNKVVPLMYHCLFSAYIETSQVCKAEGMIKAGKFRKDSFWVKLFIRWDLRDAKREQKIKKCP